ncbi:NAD+ kinase [Jatrophihabitans endophyticus]|uniref:NAD kinase n=1 Tax=Jatrophihabitans endophyticus TaxID=1206085 RepID=A0A1M5MPB3_9ACTN|nr:NAD kinase [Jatrophihabitans endophyticus]SHG79148.1 NAD+ kinase [Jatrophihabitans endophyticus]
MRAVLLVVHTQRRRIVSLATQAARQLRGAGFDVRMLLEEADACGGEGVTPADAPDAARGCEFALAFGGDGTFLRAAELARPAGVAMLGVNLGHVGFLAEAEPQELAARVDALVAGRYTVEERVTVDAEIVLDGAVRHRAWALNEVSLERTNRERMLEIAVAVDERPMLRFGCDGLLCATPTGSTAYAFSAGGPIIWPDVDAMLIVPNAAHALFARPVVVAPTSVVDIDLVSAEHAAMLSADGRRSFAVPAGARVRVRKGELPVRVVRLDDVPFTDRLVSKFQLPVRSLREASPPIPDLDE